MLQALDVSLTSSVLIKSILIYSCKSLLQVILDYFALTFSFPVHLSIKLDKIVDTSEISNNLIFDTNFIEYNSMDPSPW